MNRLTKELKLFGFFCFKENELYMLDTGKYTSLVIEGYKKPNDIYYRYTFYKQTFHKYRSNSVTTYGKHLTPAKLLERVRIYLSNRTNYLNGRSKIEL